MQYYNKISILIVFLLIFWNTISIKAQVSDSTNVSKDSSIALEVTPSGAIWRSLVMPGWGQLYVESYWKAPIFFGGAVTLGALIYYNHTHFMDYANKWDNMNLDDPQYNTTKLWREYYRDNRDMSAFYLLAVYVLATVDAYVGAHLYYFDVNDDISLNFVIKSGYISPMLGINLSIK